MPSENAATGAVPPQTEKPQHYTYLKGFRTNQCELFLQHKCNQHRPFTCFNYHFLNQKRRRPVRNRDGVFNYSADQYCQKYDEASGQCSDGDECSLLHRNTGDTERRYHLRYYKTSSCVYETDTKGHCVKNGPHCAFAHGPHDMRTPVYDIREFQGNEQSITESSSDLNGINLDKEKIIADDPKWNDATYVLQNYKTEQCRKPPRLCRQGYACPQFHNNKDKRRNPRLFKYRSTPCPNVKHGDEWGDPTLCENGDSCPYCHTRTEQQFHPEIYKSTKCNDMVQTSYCPRGPFCAFAHVEHEMTAKRDLDKDADPQQQHSTSSRTLPTGGDTISGGGTLSVSASALETPPSNECSLSHSSPAVLTNSTSTATLTTNGQSPPPALDLGKGRSESTSSQFSDETFYPRAPGSEQRSRRSTTSTSENEESIVILDELVKRQQLNSTASLLSNPQTWLGMTAPYPPTSNMIQQGVLDSALEENSVRLNELHVNASRSLNGDDSISSSLTAGIRGQSSLPVSIPDQRIPSTGRQTSGSPLTSYSHPYLQHSSSNPVEGWTQRKWSGGSYDLSHLAPTIGTGSAPQNGSGGGLNELQKAREDLDTMHQKLVQWNQALEGWKKEADTQARNAKFAEEQRDKLLLELAQYKQEMFKLSGGPFLHCLQRISELRLLPFDHLKHLRQQLKMDMDTLDKIMVEHHATHQQQLCFKCGQHPIDIILLPCEHRVLCALCAQATSICPACNKPVSQKQQVLQT